MRPAWRGRELDPLAPRSPRTARRGPARRRGSQHPRASEPARPGRGLAGRPAPGAAAPERGRAVDVTGHQVGGQHCSGLRPGRHVRPVDPLSLVAVGHSAFLAAVTPRRLWCPGRGSPSRSAPPAGVGQLPTAVAATRATPVSTCRHRAAPNRRASPAAVVEHSPAPGPAAARRHQRADGPARPGSPPRPAAPPRPRPTAARPSDPLPLLGRPNRAVQRAGHIQPLDNLADHSATRGLGSDEHHFPPHTGADAVTADRDRACSPWRRNRLQAGFMVWFVQARERLGCAALFEWSWLPRQSSCGDGLATGITVGARRHAHRGFSPSAPRRSHSGSSPFCSPKFLKFFVGRSGWPGRFCRWPLLFFFYVGCGRVGG